MKKQLSETSTANKMVEWKRDVTELWVLRMSNGQYLQFMPRRLEDISREEKLENPTKYKPVEQFTQWALLRAKIVSIKRTVT